MPAFLHRLERRRRREPEFAGDLHDPERGDHCEFHQAGCPTTWPEAMDLAQAARRLSADKSLSVTLAESSNQLGGLGALLAEIVSQF